MTEKITVSVLLDPKTLDKVVKLQKKRNIFSRSALLREIVEKGLEEISKKQA